MNEKKSIVLGENIKLQTECSRDKLLNYCIKQIKSGNYKHLYYEVIQNPIYKSIHSKIVDDKMRVQYCDMCYIYHINEPPLSFYNDLSSNHNNNNFLLPQKRCNYFCKTPEKTMTTKFHEMYKKINRSDRYVPN